MLGLLSIPRLLDRAVREEQPAVVDCFSDGGEHVVGSFQGGVFEATGKHPPDGSFRDSDPFGEEGFVLDAIEMRLFAAFAGKGAMLEQGLEPDGDPHSYTAYHVGSGDRTRRGVVTPARQQAKVFNFQMIYGGGLKTIQQFFGVSRSRASEMLDRYHEAYPEISLFQQRIRLKLEDQGYVTTPWKRRHRVDKRKPVYEQAYKFPNKLIQGTAADLLKDAIVKIHAAGIEFILPVHDEIIAHVPEAEAEEAARIIEKCMTEHPRIDKIVPITAEAQIVDRWSDAKQPGYVPDYAKEAA